MTILPFICLGVGISLGLFLNNSSVIVFFDRVSTIALVILMLSIGIGIGADKSIIKQFGFIGFNCVVIAILAIAFSVLFTVVCEKTVLPLKAIDEAFAEMNYGINQSENNDGIIEKKRASHFVWIMPGSVVVGLMIGVIFRQFMELKVMNALFTVALIILYVCVGVSQGSNRDVFKYIKMLGFKVIWLSIAILFGSLTGGFVASIILNIPMHIGMLSAGGMSFYSITGAYMTQSFGLAIGTYGFIVNVLREFFTILFMPVLIKISLGSPIAGGAAGDMDTMLAPVTKFVGVRLGLVTLLTGTILTFIVPFLLPVLKSILLS